EKLTDELTDNVFFIGPNTSSPWIPLAYQGGPRMLRVSGQDNYSRNPFAAYLSRSLSPVLFLWSLDSGYVSGYSLYEKGDLTESEVLFCSSARIQDELFPNEKVPTIGRRGRLGYYLHDPEFDYKRFTSQFGSLEEATGMLAAQLGLDVHLID